MRDRIHNYNTAMGIKNTNDSGYHETITLFWMGIIIIHLVSQGKDCSFVDIVNHLISTYENERFIFEYYSRNLLLSWEARISWVEPDIKPFNYSINFNF